MNRIVKQFHLFFDEQKKNPNLSKIVVGIYRIGNITYYHFHVPILRQIILFILRMLNLFINRLIFHCEIGFQTKIGYGLKINHPWGIIIAGDAEIGENFECTHYLTVGYAYSQKFERGGYPSLGKDCYAGVNAIIIGDIKIGDRCKIGANAVVTKDYGDLSVLIGSPAKNVALS